MMNLIFNRYGTLFWVVIGRLAEINYFNLEKQKVLSEYAEYIS